MYCALQSPDHFASPFIARSIHDRPQTRSARRIRRPGISFGGPTEKAANIFGLIALILGVVGWIIAIIVTVVVAASSVLSADSRTTVTSGSGSSTHTKAPTGQFCQVNVTVKNRSTSSITLSSDSLTGYIGKASYDSDDEADNFGSLSNALSPLNPGLSTDCKFYVDVPSGQKLSSVKLGPGLSFSDGRVTVDVG